MASLRRMRYDGCYRIHFPWSFMEVGVETLLCPSCRSLVEAPQDSKSARCQHCGSRVVPGGDSTAGDESAENPLRDLVLRIYCRVMIGLLVYVLSTGPMYWAVYEAFNASGSTFLAKLYFPIALACEKSEVVCDWFDWYVGLWVF